jgi:hypothetical protein
MSPCDCKDKSTNAIERAAYIKENPNYCKNCEGWGGFASTYDPSPPGVSLGSGSMQDWDACPECTDAGICPRCGAPYDIDLDTCLECDWTSMSPGLPPEGECLCWAEEL